MHFITIGSEKISRIFLCALYPLRKIVMLAEDTLQLTKKLFLMNNKNILSYEKAK